MDDWFTAANLNSALARPGHQPTVATGSFLAARLEAKPAECEAGSPHHCPVRMGWAKLLSCVFKIDMKHCPNCGGELKSIATILEAPVIEKILTHLGLQIHALPRARLLVAGRCRRPDAAQP